MFFLYLFISAIVDDCTLYKFVLKKFKKIEGKKRHKSTFQESFQKLFYLLLKKQ